MTSERAAAGPHHERGGDAGAAHHVPGAGGDWPMPSRRRARSSPTTRCWRPGSPWTISRTPRWRPCSTCLRGDRRVKAPPPSHRPLSPSRATPTGASASDFMLGNKVLVEGSFYTYQDYLDANPVVIIEETLAEENELAVGDTITATISGESGKDAEMELDGHRHLRDGGSRSRARAATWRPSTPWATPSTPPSRWCRRSTARRDTWISAPITSTAWTAPMSCSRPSMPA